MGDVQRVCIWARLKTAKPTVLVAASVAAPQAGAVFSKDEAILGFVAFGYPFGGWCSAWKWQGEKRGLCAAPKPKLFIQGDQDEHTSVTQLRRWVDSDPSA